MLIDCVVLDSSNSICPFFPRWFSYILNITVDLLYILSKLYICEKATGQKSV